MNNKIIITLSGGLDSSTVLAKVFEEKKDIYALTVNYGQKNWNKEIENVQKLCEIYNVKELKIIDCTWLGKMGGSAVTDSSINLEVKNDDKIYVPFRNTIILSACIAWAEILNCDLIYTGSINGDAEDICYDNTKKYYQILNMLVKEATRKNIKIEAPLINFDKKEVLELAISLNVPLEYTWSCVINNDYPCGKCFSCLDRKMAFNMLNQTDPNYTKVKEKKYGK